MYKAILRAPHGALTNGTKSPSHLQKEGLSYNIRQSITYPQRNPAEIHANPPLIHRDFRMDINSLSPSNFNAALLFSCLGGNHL